MYKIVKHTNPKANKNHICNGREQLIYFFEQGVDFDEIPQQIKKCKGIKKGDNYSNQTQAEDGVIQNWKSCKNCHETIIKFELYPTD